MLSWKGPTRIIQLLALCRTPRESHHVPESAVSCVQNHECLFCFRVPHMLILHTRTHTPTHAPRGFHPLKTKYESSSYWSIWGSGASDWCAESLSCSGEPAWKPGILLEMLCWAGAQEPENFTSSAGKGGCFSFSWTHTVASCCETMVTEGTAATETSSIYVHR